MQNFLSQAMEAAEEPGIHPGQGYPNIEHAQYDNSQYGFAQDNHPFPIDQNLDMSVNFASNDGKNQDGGIDGNHMSLAGQNGHNGVLGSHHGSTNTSTSLATATQPQTPHHQSTKRKSLEDASENNPTGGDSRRKRSKVSRACDQCRKKKIRCDADSGDGTLKTCSNCIKQGQTCDYNRVPQKRGPSKGYIKDLSERVHHLEDSLANSGTYRSSVDASNYPDPGFSPDEDSALKRHTSITQQRSPFADFTRDRFPSIGGWTNNNLTSAPFRERGSIAIPPDQVGSSQPASAKTPTSWWTPQKLPAEKTKTPAEIEETKKTLETLTMDQYYQIVHPQCPILPENAKVMTVLEKASVQYIQMFKTAIDLLPQKSKDNSTVHGKSREDLENFLLHNARTRWEEKTNIDNLVLLWANLLLQIVLLDDMESYRSQKPLITISLDLVGGFVKNKDFMHDFQHEYEWIQSLHIAAMFARLAAIAQGDSSDPLPSYLTTYLNNDWQIVAQRPRFLVMMTDMLQAALSTLPRDGGAVTLESSIGYTRLQSSNIRAWLSASEISPEEPFVKEIEAFASLLSLRFILPGAQPAIIGPVVNLVDAIRLNSPQQNDGQYVFNPLSFHTFTLATTALLELLSCNFDDHQQGESMVETAKKEMMEQLAELVAKRAGLGGGAGSLSWPKALIRLVEDKMKQHGAVPTPVEKGEDEIVPELARILHRGYLYPLLDTVSR